MTDFSSLPDPGTKLTNHVPELSELKESQPVPASEPQPVPQPVPPGVPELIETQPELQLTAPPISQAEPPEVESVPQPPAVENSTPQPSTPRASALSSEKENSTVAAEANLEVIRQNLEKKLVPTPREYRTLYLDMKARARARASKENRWQKIGHFLGTIPILEILTVLAGLSGMTFLCVYVGKRAGLYSTIIAGSMAVAPLLVVMSVLLYLTRWDKEPSWLIAVAFLWGAGVATSLALLGNHGGMSLVSDINFGPTPLQTEGVTATIVAPIVEESLKGIGVLLILLIRRRYLNSPLNGLVIAGIAAAGFAYTENILYFARSIEQLPVIFIVRGIISPFAHSIFTSFTGVAIAVALTRIANCRAKVGLILAGFTTAMCLHATWNGLASYNPLYFLVGYLLFWGPLFTIWIITALVLATRQRKWINIGLAQYYQQGWISVAEWQTLAALDRRRLAVIRAKQFGRKAKRQVKIFQKAASSLALNYVTSVHIGWQKPLFASNIASLSKLLEARADYLQSCGMSAIGGEVGALAFLDSLIASLESDDDLLKRPQNLPENLTQQVSPGAATLMVGSNDETAAPIRKAARIIIIGDYAHVLLVHGHDFSDSNHHWWFTVGGGIKSGETSRQAAVRELYEETGLQIGEERLFGPVIQRRGKFEFRTVTKIQEEEFYLLYISGSEACQIHSQNWTSSEQQCLDELRWWPIGEIFGLLDSSTIYPQILPSIVCQYRYSWDGNCIYIDETR